RADDLAGRRNEWREARIGANLGDFRQYFFHAIAGALLLQLALPVGKHAAGNLAVENFGLDAGNVGEELLVTWTDAGEIFLQRYELRFIELRLEARAFEHFHQALGGVVAGAEAERADGGIDAVRAGFDGFHQADHRHAGGGVDVDVYADVLAA